MMTMRWIVDENGRLTMQWTAMPADKNSVRFENTSRVNAQENAPQTALRLAQAA